MGLFISNSMHIAGIGLFLIVITYFFTHLRRKNNKNTKDVPIVRSLKDLLRNVLDKINISKEQRNTANRPSEKYSNLKSGHSPPRLNDRSYRSKIVHPSRKNNKSGNSAGSTHRSPSSHTHLGNLSFERRKYGKAAWHYKQALQIDGYFDPAHVGMGNIEYAHGKVFSAMKYYTFAVKMNHNNHDALVGLGNCFQQIGKNEKALECYEKAYILDMRNKDLNARLSNIYMANEEYDKAKDILTQSIALYPDCSRFYKSIGDMYWILNKEKKAIDAYIHFIDLRCDKNGLANLVRSRFERYLALEIISDLIKKKKKINYDAFVKELSRMMTIFLIRQGILGELNNAKQKAYQGFSNYFIDKVLLCVAQQHDHRYDEDIECNLSTGLRPYLSSKY